MPKNDIISITDMTEKAYDCIRQEDYALKTCQQYWYCGVVPIRRYCEERGIKTYSSESISDCVTWFLDQYKQGTVYRDKYQAVRKIASIMEYIAKGEPYQWQALTPWYIAELPDPYRTLLENYVKYKRENGCKETSIRGAKPVVKHFLMYAASYGYESVRNITLADITGYIPKLAKSYQRIGDAIRSALQSLRSGAFMTKRSGPAPLLFALASS